MVATKMLHSASIRYSNQIHTNVHRGIICLRILKHVQRVRRDIIVMVVHLHITATCREEQESYLPDIIQLVVENSNPDHQQYHQLCKAVRFKL